MADVGSQAKISIQAKRRETAAKAETLRGSMRLVLIAWGFGAAWMYAVQGAPQTKFALAIGLPTFGFGVLAALPFMGALMQLPASYVIEKYGHRKRVFFWSAIAHRALWAVIGLVPWVVPSGFQWQGFMIVLVVSTLLANVGGPAWMSWVGDLVPAKLRGRWFGKRNQLGQLVGVIVTLIVGYALDQAEISGNLQGITTPLMIMISVTFAIAAVLGVVDILIHAPVPDEKASRGDRTYSFRRLLGEPLSDRNFLHYLGFSATITLAVGFMGQFLWLYVFDVVKLSNTNANLMLVAGPLLVSVVSFGLWGKVIDQIGRKPVLVICVLMASMGGAVWTFVTPELWWLGYIICAVGNLAWPGIGLASFNLLLWMSESPGSKARSSAYVAVNSVAVAVAGACSGLLAGAVAAWLGNEWSVIVLGWTLTYHHVLFWASTVLRLAALLFLIGMIEPRAFTTRDAARYMGANIYSNLTQAITIPGRMVWRVGRYSYRLTPRGRSEDRL